MKKLLVLMMTLVVTSCITMRRGDDTVAVSEEEVKRPTLEFFGDKYEPIEGATFIGDWIRGEPSDKGFYSEQLIVNRKEYRYYEDGTLVMRGSTVVRDNKILINPKVNKSRYYGKFEGCWGGLRNNGNSLDLFGNVKGMLCFDKKK